MTRDTTACILCSRNCGLEVEIEDNRITRIRGDARHPDSRGYICQKAARLDYYQNHDDRLTQPLRRGPDGEFEAVSWDEALSDIASRLNAVRENRGPNAFALCGGGGQGNHLGALYGSQLTAAMDSKFVYSSLAQEKSGDFWVNGRLFGAQTCHVSECVEHADYVVLIGTNPFQSHGIPNARETLRALSKDPDRTMVVIDPRQTETVRWADIHLQLKPGTDAYLIAAMLAIIVRNGWHDEAFVQRHCTGFEAVEAQLKKISPADYAERSGVALEQVERVASGISHARTASVRVDLGTQHTLHTTLNAYLEKLLYLLTGQFGREGTNNLHTSLIPLIGNTDERRVVKGKKLRRTSHHGMMPIAGMYPPNILPDEINHGGLRAIVVDSCNALLSWPDTQALSDAFSRLDLLVVIDVAMTETARAADYVLPASSQFEKWEATGFNLEFPNNYFHLRHPLFPAAGDSLPEAEIYTRLLERMGLIPANFPLLEKLARFEPGASRHRIFLAGLMAALRKNRALARFAPSILYRTLGRYLPGGSAAAAPLLPLALRFAATYPAQVRRALDEAKTREKPVSLGVRLFRRILKERSGLIISKHVYGEAWDLVRNPDGRIHLEISEMLEQLDALENETLPGEGFPFILMAGERRSYNANQIYRDPRWRKTDPRGALRMHPEDAAALGIEPGDRVVCRSDTGSVESVVEMDRGLRRGVATLPHGYGIQYKGGRPLGPQINRLTAASHCDPLSKTPYHKYVPVRIEKQTESDPIPA
jgi:anaerobic selenocysteine-containing dehydrogenase